MQDSAHDQLLDATRGYKMPTAAVQLLTQHPPLIIAGVTASGKDAIGSELEKTGQCKSVVTHTTRPKRTGERDGEHYWFVDDAQMLHLLNEQALIEAKMVHGDTIYGPSLKAYQDVLNVGQKPLLTIDIQGVNEIIKRVSGIRPTFILPPNFTVWMERLEGRGAMSHTERSRRLRSAQRELEEAMHNERFMLVVNREIPAAAREVIKGATDAVTQKQNQQVAQELIEHIRNF